MARQEGIGLALSGGGFRATLFHLGSLWRLNELGLLPKISQITSVSGGSILSAYLGLRWDSLDFDKNDVAVNFKEIVGAPIQEFCGHTIDFRTIAKGLLNPFRQPSHYLSKEYDEALYEGAKLSDFPPEKQAPRFTIYATNVQTGSSVRMSRDIFADYKLGQVKNPDLSLASAVAASSGFPPFYVPLKVKFADEQWTKTQYADLFNERELRKTVLLGDGGIYDNLGLERIWRRYTTVLVSDAGSPFSIAKGTFWLKVSMTARTLKTLYIAIEQTRALRKRILVADLISRKMAGAYWGISTAIADYELEVSGLAGPLLSDTDRTRSLANMRTRLNRFSKSEQNQLINWGYALTDAAYRRHVDKDAAKGTLPL